MIIYESKTVVAIALPSSTNRKVGTSVQIWLLDRRMHPHDSRKSGADADNQCKGCELASYNGCYVITPAISAIWNTYQRGGYEHGVLGSERWNRFFKGKFVRFGAYGNPSLLPLPMVVNIAGLAKRHTGYFHDWALMLPAKAKAYGKYFMASVNEDTLPKAKALGLRTFRVLPVSASAEEVSGMECLADTKGMQCKDCGLCDGTQRRNGTLPHIWIRAHGYQVKRVTT